jgi:hypothetical protein
LRERVPETVTRHDYEYVARTFQALRKIRVGGQVLRELDARKVTFVLPVVDHRLEEVKFDDAAQANLTANPGKLQRQRGTPGARADDGNRFGCRTAD